MYHLYVILSSIGGTALRKAGSTGNVTTEASLATGSGREAASEMGRAADSGVYNNKGHHSNLRRNCGGVGRSVGNIPSSSSGGAEDCGGVDGEAGVTTNNQFNNHHLPPSSSSSPTQRRLVRSVCVCLLINILRWLCIMVVALPLTISTVRRCLNVLFSYLIISAKCNRIPCLVRFCQFISICTSRGNISDNVISHIEVYFIIVYRYIGRSSEASSCYFGSLSYCPHFSCFVTLIDNDSEIFVVGCLSILSCFFHFHYD